MTSTLPMMNFTPLVRDLNAPRVDPTSIISLHDEIERSARVLDHTQAESVVSSLAFIRQGLATITSATQSLEALHAFLAAQKAKYQKAETYCQALIAPIRRLPPEVLQDIFVLVRANEDASTGQPSIVAQVNRYWRRVALETPRLWTTIPPLTLQVRRDPDEQLRKLAVWAARARACPISLLVTLEEVFLSREEDRTAKYPSVFTTLASIVEDHAPRIRSLILRGYASHTTDTENPRFFSPSLSLPRLKVLDVGLGRSDGSSAMALELCRAHCPATERLLFQTDVFVEYTTAFSWQALKALRGRISPADCARLFSLLELSLEFLEIAIADWDWTLPDTPFPPLTHLTTLVMRHERTAAIPLQAATFPAVPALRHLILYTDTDEWWEHNDLHDLYNLLRAWGKQLHYLALPFGLRFHNVQECLKLAPNIVALRLPSNQDATSLLEPSAIPLSQLSHLEIPFRKNWFDDGASPEQLLDLVVRQIGEGKTYGISTISLVLFVDYLDAKELYGPSLLGAQELLRRSGLSVHLIYLLEFSPTKSPYFSDRGLFTDWHPLGA